MPCPMPHCNVCDHSDKACESCKKDFGITPSGHCAICGPGCIECAVANICDKCGDGFVLVNGACHACGDKCHTCAASGAGSCDKGECEQGWTAISLPTKGSDKESYACRPCSDPGCSTCDIQGPGGCDDAEMFGPFLPDGGPGHIPP
ncbi:unnamed protein product [Symbiodinium natans]|uniref:Uncharacterized protein n=1 Tax=Symbiodinium natans TaxID=878477 RepID=A0A812IAY4_9DINO|nr:unnamed protein product [Symbiodinium natans]